MKPALDGLLLVDLSTGIAGPYAAMLLTDMGAECVKIEPREGDQARDLPGFQVWNRGKKASLLIWRLRRGRKSCIVFWREQIYSLRVIAGDRQSYSAFDIGNFPSLL